MSAILFEFTYAALLVAILIAADNHCILVLPQIQNYFAALKRPEKELLPRKIAVRVMASFRGAVIRAFSYQ